MPDKIIPTIEFDFTLSRKHKDGQYLELTIVKILKQKHLTFKLEKEYDMKGKKKGDLSIMLGTTISNTHGPYSSSTIQIGLTIKDVSVEGDDLNNLINDTRAFVGAKVQELFDETLVEQQQLPYFKNLKKVE